LRRIALRTDLPAALPYLAIFCSSRLRFNACSLN
jgi:hypothetical protein